METYTISDVPWLLILKPTLDRYYKKLRVLTNVGSFQNEEQLATRAIIIEDDIAQELLLQQFITDIVVDGANNKWIGTADSGFYGFTKRAETKYHFTESNSPLPSNVINDDDMVRQEKSTSLPKVSSLF
jgi:lipopolysaccharide export LptBFGC system permease protein LptF